MRRAKSDSDLSSEEDFLLEENALPRGKMRRQQSNGRTYHQEKLVFTTSAAAATHSKNRKRPRPAAQQADDAQRADSAEGTREHQLWVDKHAPQSTGDLVLHPTKVQAIRDWLLRSVTSAATRPSVLAICGKSGSGKSTAVSIIAKEMGIQVTDWSEDLWSGSRQIFQLDGDEQHPRYQTFASEFSEFVVRSAYPSLDMSAPSSGSNNNSSRVAGGRAGRQRQEEAEEQQPARRVVMMHDAPQLKGVQLADLLTELRCPLVVVVSDVTDKGDAMYAVERLLSGSSRSDLLDVETLFVPPVTELRIAKVLTAISRKERLRVAQAQLTALSTAAMGDLRHAIMAMQALHSHAKARGSSLLVEELSLAPGERDSAYSAMHSVGKLLHAKLDQAQRLDFDPDNVVDSSELGIDLLLDFLHHNCVDFLADEDQAVLALTSLGDAEILHAKTFDSSSARDHSDEIFPQAYVAAIAGRSVAAAVGDGRGSQRTGFKPMHRPRLGDLRTSRRLFAQNLQTLRRHRLESGVWLGQTELAVDEVPYLRLLAQHDGVLSRGVAFSVSGLNQPLHLSARPSPQLSAEEQLAMSTAVLALDDIEEDFGEDDG